MTPAPLGFHTENTEFKKPAMQKPFPDWNQAGCLEWWRLGQVADCRCFSQPWQGQHGQHGQSTSQRCQEESVWKRPRGSRGRGQQRAGSARLEGRLTLTGRSGPTGPNCGWLQGERGGGQGGGGEEGCGGGESRLLH